MAKHTKKKTSKKALAKKGEGGGPELSMLARLSAAVHKRHGSGSLMTADQASRMVIPRISTGIFEVDRAVGGGLPHGRFTQVYGEKSTGKSSLFMRAVAQAQRMCGNCYRKADLVPGQVEALDATTGRPIIVDSMVVGDCVCGSPRNMVVGWIDQEGTWDSNWAACLGVFEERLLMSWPIFAEEAVNIVMAMLTEGVDIVVLDSVSAMTPMKEIEGDAVDHDKLVGLHARLMGSAIRRWNAQIQNRRRQDPTGYQVPSIWLVNQLRMKIGVMFGDPRTTTGGKAIGFATSLEIETKKGDSSKVQPGGYRTDADTGEVEWVELSFMTQKNKTYPAKQGGKYRISLQDTGSMQMGGVIDHGTVLFHAVRTGIVEHPSDAMYIFNGEKFRGKERILDHWRYDPELYEVVKENVMRLHLERPDRTLNKGASEGDG